jgi:hypothetical protein
MQIWDPDLPMPFDDLFEVQAPPSEVLVVQTQSRGQLVLNNLTTTQTLGGRPAPDHPKAPFIPQIIPINIHTIFWKRKGLNQNTQIWDLKT